jgi:hypothetical protein
LVDLSVATTDRSTKKRTAAKVLHPAAMLGGMKKLFRRLARLARAHDNVVSRAHVRGRLCWRVALARTYRTRARHGGGCSMARRTTMSST